MVRVVENIMERGSVVALACAGQSKMYQEKRVKHSGKFSSSADLNPALYGSR